MARKSDRLEDDLRHLEEWAGTEIPECRRDTKFLQTFLVGCKHKTEVARNKIRNWYHLRRNTIEWFGTRDPWDSKIAHLLNLGVFIPQSVKDPEGRTVIVVRATINDPSTHPMDEVFKVGIMIVDLILELDQSVAEEGVVVIIDLDKVSAAHALQLSPRILRNAVHAWQDCYPIRIKAIHFINCPLYVDVVLSVLKSFMREKLRRRVYKCRRDLSVLVRTVSAQCIPQDYGGDLANVKSLAAQWADRVNIAREWFMGPDLPMSKEISERLLNRV